MCDFDASVYNKKERKTKRKGEKPLSYSMIIANHLQIDSLAGNINKKEDNGLLFFVNDHCIF